jgi:hypothetical protein
MVVKQSAHLYSHFLNSYSPKEPISARSSFGLIEYQLNLNCLVTGRSCRPFLQIDSAGCPFRLQERKWLELVS